jgi:ribosomal protein L17
MASGWRTHLSTSFIALWRNKCMQHARSMHAACITARHHRRPCRTMVTQLLEHERVRTTLPKALALRRVADHTIGLGKEVRVGAYSPCAQSHAPMRLARAIWQTHERTRLAPCAPRAAEAWPPALVWPCPTAHNLPDAGHALRVGPRDLCRAHRR